MAPYQYYLLYQIERPKTAPEIRHADERAGRTAAAAAGILRALTRPARRARPALGSTVSCRQAWPRCRGQNTTKTMGV
jgi:hypothetical protein